MSQVRLTKENAKELKRLSENSGVISVSAMANLAIQYGIKELNRPFKNCDNISKATIPTFPTNLKNCGVVADDPNFKSPLTKKQSDKLFRQIIRRAKEESKVPRLYDLLLKQPTSK